MNPFSTLMLAIVAALAVSCASKPAYTSSQGAPLREVGTYPYAQENPGAAAPQTPSGAQQLVQEQTWPKTYVVGDTTNTIHQLQVDSWDGSALTARHAVAIQSAGQKAPVYGVATVRATTLVDKDNRTVSLLNLQVTGVEFPSAKDKAEEYARLLKQIYPTKVQSLSLDTLENFLAANQQIQATKYQLKNDPPKVIFSEKPAVLVPIDGQPVWRSVEGTELERVINTRALVLKDRAGKLYVKLGGQYLTAADLNGAWAPAAAPAGTEVAEKIHKEALPVMGNEQANTNAPMGGVGTNGVPAVYVATEPTELIVFEGAPNYVPVPGTQLLYVTNTTANVFRLLGDQSTYVLLSGRWYKASDLQGPWQYVDGGQLPADFAKIPDDSPKENVKASVPGTPQAREALIANTIPQTAPVQRNSQMQDPQIDGPPRLEPISGTPLHYVVNSATPIIKVDEKSWYACQDGVWYAATSVDGPWFVAESVPSVIYSIPPSSPVHYVTYVRAYDSTASAVYYGYTPGYLGTVVDTDAVVVYGTGYYYEPWVGTVYYGPPVTWGYGWAPYWSPWAGWSFGFGFGWAYGYPYYWGYYPYYYHCYPYWGPYRHYAYYGHHYHGSGLHGYSSAHGPGGWGGTSANIYQAQASTSPNRISPASSRFPSAAYARAYNSRTGAVVAGERVTAPSVVRVPPRGTVNRQPIVANSQSAGRNFPGGRPSRSGQPGSAVASAPQDGSNVPDVSTPGPGRPSPGGSAPVRIAPAPAAPPPSGGVSRPAPSSSGGGGGGWRRGR